MRGRHPELESIEVPDQGHVPLLDEPDLIKRVAAFVKSCDEKAEVAGFTPCGAA